MSSSQMSKHNVIKWLCGVFVLGACGEDATVGLNQPNLGGGPPISAFTDTDAPDLEVADGGELSDSDTADSDTVNADSTDPDTIAPGDAVVPDAVEPDDVGPTDTIVADVSPPIACTDASDCLQNEPCGIGACVNNICTFTTVDTDVTCSDGDPCTTGDRCTEGRCVPTGVDRCDDGDRCTVNICVSGVGCAAEPENCDDGDLCTVDSCDSSVGCVNQRRDCSEGLTPCQIGVCGANGECSVTNTEEGGACDDGYACTSGESCLGGLCLGLVNCDDGDPCTADSCGPSGACVYTRIAACNQDSQCSGLPGGSICDDNNASTTADMCINGTCRGFALHRVSGKTVQGYEGLVIREVEHGIDGWSAIFWSAKIKGNGAETSLASALARITNPAAPVIYDDTIKPNSLYHSLSDGVVVRDNKKLFLFMNGFWMSDNDLDDTLDDEDIDAVSAVFSRLDRSSTSDAATRRTWVGGEYNDDGVVLACTTTALNTTCASQSFENAEEEAFPAALAGVPRCYFDGSCKSQWMGAANLFVDESNGAALSYFSDSYVNPTGISPTWTQGRFGAEALGGPVWSMTAWGNALKPRMLVVGGGGYLNHMSGTGGWSGPLELRAAEQAKRTFTGVSVSGDTVIVSATSYATDATLYELWTAPAYGDLAAGANWRIHELGRGPAIEASGLYDVAARANGEVMAVGAGAREGMTSNDRRWLDGFVYRR